MSATSSAVKGLGDTDLIQVVGRDQPYPYGKVKDAVLYLGGAYYFKTDENNLVRVKDPSGKKRYFRKQSKLVREISPGRFVHKAFLVQTDDGVWLDKDDPSTVVVDGKPTRKEYTIEIGGKYYLKTNPNILTCVHSGKLFLKDDMFALHPTYYKEKQMVHNDYKGLMILIDGGYIHPNDAIKMLNREGEEIYYHRKELKGMQPTFNVFHKFRDVTNPQLGRIDYITMMAADEKATVRVPELDCRVHKAHLEAVMQIYNDVILVREATATAAIKNALKYSDDGPDENQAKVVKKIPEPWPGKYNIHTPRDMSPVISKTCNLTGGLKYTFGLEIETAQGLVPNEVVDRLKLRIVGDRSVGAGEYVTGLLHGDDGIKLLEEQCKAIAQYCLVDDKCGLHAHVGGMKDTKGVAEGDFGRQFARYAVDLGWQIEESLYKTCPKSRRPTLKHCHSIMRWKGINDDNWREYLGAFVFGPEENWDNPWSFAPYKYGTENRTKQQKLGEFCGGRYKWLNLVHILTRSSINTCELRLFPGTTSFEKVYNYLMLSMAFTWFVENKQNRIVKGDVTLNEVLTAPFEKKFPEIGEKLVQFYAARTEKFDRKSIYNKPIPKAIF